MFDHVGIPVSDVAASRRFYEQALEPLGAEVAMEWEGGVAFKAGEGPMFAIRQRDQVAPVHVAFSTDRAGVNAFYDAAIAAGGKDNGAPGIRAHYHQDYYAAFVHDPDGHNIEAVSHASE
jgi:catechol 2,3-dioxygenase-like lactoylglutathione lyase family enzyme